MGTQLFGLDKFFFHLFANKASKDGNDADHERHVAKADKGKDWALVESDAKSTNKHGNSVDKLANFLADSLSNSLKVLGNLCGQRLNLLSFEELGLLLEKLLQVKCPKVKGQALSC